MTIRGFMEDPLPCGIEGFQPELDKTHGEHIAERLLGHCAPTNECLHQPMTATLDPEF